MTLTVDIVVVGANPHALATAVECARAGKRVLVVTRRRDPGLRRRVRRARRLAGAALSGRITVLTGAAVECIAGIRTVEAVLARDLRTGRRVDINATAFLTCDDESDVALADTETELSA
jgi:thioredoxin reductase